MADNGITKWIRDNVNVALVVAFLLGAIVGLVVLGWWLWPVQWTNADLADLRPIHKDAYIQLVADSYATTNDADAALGAIQALKGAGEQDDTLSAMLNDLIDARTAAGQTAQADRLRDLASALNLPQPSPEAPTVEPAVTGGTQLTRTIGIVFFLALLGGGLVLLLTQLQKREATRRGRASAPRQPYAPAGGAEPEGAATTAVSETALGHFETTYHLGDEGYDLSYSIESAGGEFLGECGVSALEELGIGEPGRVSAVELWLFDKEDVRTEARILLSDQAFGDEALRERLASKGTLVQAEQGKIVTVETANLRLIATISDLEYEGPLSAIFAKLTTALEITRR
jgi:hypothetical protein